MAKTNSKRKTRSDKFPLTLHPTGQYCKKIKGKLYYFGSNKQQALQKYLRYASDLHYAERDSSHAFSEGEITLKSLCNLYLEHQLCRMQGGDLTASYYALLPEN